MSYPKSLITLLLVFLGITLTLGVPSVSIAEETWSVAKARVQGNPVIYKFMNELPEKELREKMSWLTVISWKYDGSTNNGMPPKEINDAMIILEDGLETIKGREILYFDVYTGTGNNQKEFVFYITDRDKFMSNFNEALNGHPAYPIRINFYQDKEWSDFIRLRSDFGAPAEE